MHLLIALAIGTSMGALYAAAFGWDIGLLTAIGHTMMWKATFDMGPIRSGNGLFGHPRVRSSDLGSGSSNSGSNGLVGDDGDTGTPRRPTADRDLIGTLWHKVHNAIRRPFWNNTEDVSRREPDGAPGHGQTVRAKPRSMQDLLDETQRIETLIKRYDAVSMGLSAIIISVSISVIVLALIR